jgi:UDP-4-amino-4,6-dideoxy-N-acetyl-beta-L-altrosamine transaminase
LIPTFPGDEAVLRKRKIPYGRQSVSEEDIAAVVEVMRSDWLTQGPVIERFERAVARYCGARFAVAVSSGTAALHLASLAAGFGPGDEVITSPNSFVASANCIVYSGARPVFADIDRQTYCIDPDEILSRLSPKTRGLIPVHFAGQPCDMNSIDAIARSKQLIVIEDAAHAIGATYDVNGKTYRVGSCAHSDMTVFSFHPVKQMTSGEGGMITTNSEKICTKLKDLRVHGIVKSPERLGINEDSWYYEQQMLGFNYRLTDIQSALGLSQLSRLDEFILRRREIAESYDTVFSSWDELITPFQRSGTNSSWHLYVLGFHSLDRRVVFEKLLDLGLGVNLHYRPVHLQPYYMDNYSGREGQFPVAEDYHRGVLTLPLFPSMTDDDVNYVIDAVLTSVSEMVQ